MAIKGVDVSEMNGAVDFNTLKRAGIEFVIIRCGYGSDYTSQDDKKFSENVKKAEAAGIPWGVYLYSYATNQSMAKSEVSHVLRLLGNKVPPYGVWYDVEDGTQSGADLVPICETFCSGIEAAGLYCGIYSMVSWMNTKLSSSKLDRYDKWVAQWASQCDYKKPYGIWQYTDKLVIGGKTFDGNYAYKNYPALTRGEDDPEPKPEPEEELTYEEWKAFKERYEKEKAKEPISSWAKPAVEWAKKNKIMNGDADGSFRPRSNITREEVAQVAMNEKEVFG